MRKLDRELAIVAGGERVGRRRQLEISLGDPVIVAALGVYFERLQSRELTQSLRAKAGVIEAPDAETMMTSRPARWVRRIRARASVASFAAPRAEPALPLRSRCAAITGAT